MNPIAKFSWWKFFCSFIIHHNALSIHVARFSDFFEILLLHQTFLMKSRNGVFLIHLWPWSVTLTNIGSRSTFMTGEFCYLLTTLVKYLQFQVHYDNRCRKSMSTSYRRCSHGSKKNPARNFTLLKILNNHQFVLHLLKSNIKLC